MFDPGHIVRVIERLRAKDGTLRIFGANGHRYRLNAPIPERDISHFESSHHIRLPNDYRQFLTEVGNGGAGPFYGVFRLNEHDDGNGFCTFSEGHLVGTLSETFPHSDAWNLPPSFWAQEPQPEATMSEDEVDAEWAKWDEQIEAQYWNQSLMNGAIPICHLGCALRHWLIVNGPCYGEVWFDNRADEGGIGPLEFASGRRHTFGTWYMSWLDEAAKKFGAG